MKCPQCGTDFETAVDTCFTCGWDFNDDPADFNPQTSKLALCSLVLGIMCLFTLYLPLLLTIIIGAVALGKIRKSRGKLTGERLAMTGILTPLLSLPVMLAIGYAVWAKDAPPVPNEFTQADLIQVKPENEVTWSILCQLNDESNDPAGAPAIGLTASDINKLNDLCDIETNTLEGRFQLVREYADEIESLWNSSEKGREIFEQLSGYDEIANFAPADLEAEVVFVVDAKYMIQLYRFKSILLMLENKDAQAIEHLIIYDSVARKYTLSARPLISKLAGYAMLAGDFRTASDLLMHPNISEKSILILKSHFTPLKQNTVSMKNCLMHEYLTFKNTLPAAVPNGKDTPMLKLNSSYRYYDSFCRRWIQEDAGNHVDEYCQISVWPWEKPVWPRVSLDIEDSGNFFTPYLLYNPVGSMMSRILFPAIIKISQIKTKVLIYDDLFQWILARRQGEQGSLTARAYSDKYTVDIEKGLIFSVGPDGQPYTDDDIKLRINPELMGLK